jgi:hypothetical protein
VLARVIRDPRYLEEGAWDRPYQTYGVSAIPSAPDVVVIQAPRRPIPAALTATAAGLLFSGTIICAVAYASAPGARALRLEACCDGLAPGQ